MRKIIGLAVAVVLLGFFLFQVQNVLAGHDENHNKPITSSITPTPTPPVSSPLVCKPGWGFGDKNHCHFGPPKGHDNDKHENGKHDNDSRENGKKSDDHHENNGHH